MTTGLRFVNGGIQSYSKGLCFWNTKICYWKMQDRESIFGVERPQISLCLLFALVILAKSTITETSLSR